jgi:transposase-like protein
MRSTVERQSKEAEKVVRDIRRAARRQYSAEEKVRIVIAGLRGEESIAELCRKEGINQKYPPGCLARNYLEDLRQV